MLELAICDDDIILCNWLEQKLLHYGKANDCQISIEIYYSAEQLLNRLEEESYDMLFLDICLEHENGIDIGTEIRKKNYGKELRITYISTYQEYAMKLFRIHPFDFLVKPLTRERILETLEKCIKITENNKGIFYFNIAKTIHKLYFDEIKYFECKGNKIELHSQNDVIEYYSGMKEVEKQVIGKGFLAIHKSYIVNTMFISAYHYESVKITDGTVLPVSQKYRKKMKSYLLELL